MKLAIQMTHREYEQVLRSERLHDCLTFKEYTAFFSTKKFREYTDILDGTDIVRQLYNISHGCGAEDIYRIFVAEDE